MNKSKAQESTKDSELVQGIDFFVGEIERLHSVEFKDLKNHIGNDGLKAFTHHIPGVGILPCGAAAFDRIGKLAEKQLSAHKWHGKVFAHSVRTKAIDLTIEQIKRNGQTFDNAGAKAMFAEAIDRAAIDCKVFVHHIPCHVVDDEVPKEFRVGPIVFRQTDQFLLETEKEQNKSIERTAKKVVRLRRLNKGTKIPPTRSEATTEVTDHAEEVRAYFRKFRWVASIEIPASVYELSRRRAELCVEAALNFLRLIFGSSHSNRMRVDSHPLTPRESAALYQGPDKLFSFTLHRSFEDGNSVGKEWWSRVIAGDGEKLVEEAGEIIAMLVRWETIPPVAQRILDAMSWFGQASSDPAPGTRILKYVAAVERLTVFGKEPLTANICERVATLCCKMGGQDFDQRKNAMRKVYKARSQLAHGKWSPYAEGLNQTALGAENIVRDVIFNFLSLMLGQPLRDVRIGTSTMRKIFLNLKSQKLKSTL